MRKITSSDHPDLECQLRSVEILSDSLRKLEETLGTPIEQQEVWIKYDGGSVYCNDEQKYADFYPQFDLLVKTAQAETRNFITVVKPLNDSFLNTEGPEWVGECLDAITETADGTSGMEQFYLNTERIPTFVNECVCPALGDDIKVYGYDFNKELLEHFRKCLAK